jgi:hypothetical protein
MNVLKGAASDARVIEQIDDLYTHCGFVEDSLNYSLGSRADYPRLAVYRYAVHAASPGAI